ncbi:MAG: SCO family protein [Mariprofundaceae bacterium]
MDKRFALLSLVLAISLSVMAFGMWNLNRLPPSKYPDMGGDFVLQSASGPVSSKDIDGKVVALFFGYTHCPDICPATLNNVAEAFDLLDEEELAATEALFITLDPERDTPEVMSAYASHFHRKITGLSGSSDSIAKVAKSFFVGYQKDASDSSLGYTITHSSYVFIIRPDGSVGDFLSHSASVDELAQAIRRWLPWAKI